MFFGLAAFYFLLTVIFPGLQGLPLKGRVVLLINFSNMLSVANDFNNFFLKNHNLWNRQKAAFKWTQCDYSNSANYFPGGKMLF